MVVSDVKSKKTAFLLAFFLGGLGSHKFYLGHTGLGIVYLLVSVLTLTIGYWLVIGPLTLIESILIITKSDDEFQRVYVHGRKAMF